MKKAAYFSNTDFSLYNFRFALMEKMKEKGFAVYACAPAGKHKKSLEKRFFFYNIPLKRGVDLLGGDLLYLYRVYSFCKKEKPFLCHNFTVKPCIYATMGQSLAGVENIYCTITGVGYGFENRFLKKIVVFLYRRTLKRAKKVIFQNPDDRELFLRHRIVEKERTEVIKSSGVDTDYFYPQKKEGEEFTVSMIARLLKQKGVYEFMEASEEFDVRFLLAGPIDRENPSGIEEREIKSVEYIGEVDDSREVLSKTDIFVLPSRDREGVPKVLLEAGAMGLPLVTTDTPGCREVVDHGVNGFLAKPQDAKDLSEKIRMVMDSDTESMGKRSREKIEREFKDELVVNKTLKCYNL